MSLRSTLLTVAIGLALASCGTKRIPGTEIRDTPDARAIVSVIDQYRSAAQRRDAQTVLSLVSPRYFDNSGTADPADDQDYEQLERRLAEDYAKLAAVRLDMGVRAVDVKGDAATADVFFDGHWRIATPTGEVAKQANDVHRMTFLREQGMWKIASGL